MNQGLLQLADLISEHFWIYFFVLVRVGGFSALLPGFGERSVPTRVKLTLAVAFTVIVAPAVSGNVQNGLANAFVFVLFSEFIIGALLGIGIRIFVLALQTSGTIAAQSTSLSQILGGASVEPIPAMGYLLVISAICFAIISGLHVKAAEFLILSYDLFPAGLFLAGNDVAQWGLNHVRRAFELAFVLAAPFVVLSVLYNLALGAINKAMPQLMVAFVGAPVITFGGLFMLFLTSPIILTVWLRAVDGFLANPVQAMP